MKRHHDFLHPRCLPSTLDTFGARRAILEGLQAELPRLSGVLLDIGCGYMPYRPLLLSPPSRVERYLGLDLADNLYQTPDLVWDGVQIPLPEGAVDCALATELLEHCPSPSQVLREAYRVLRPGGVLFFSVPFLWPLHTVPHDEYRYTPFSLERLFSEAGFSEITLKALGGWDASLSQLFGLWLRRRPMPKILRGALSILGWPVVFFLHRMDKAPSAFGESQMITGLCGTAVKPLP